MRRVMIIIAALTLAAAGAWAQPAPAASAASAPLTRADITPGTQCGQRAVGWQLDFGVVERADAAWRVDAQGIWRQCQPCPPAKAEAPKSWTVGGHQCTTAHSRDTDAASPARDRVIAHGGIDAWVQWTGPMRGRLVEACHDGVRTTVAATCAPATSCDTEIEHAGHRYDGRASPVPLGTTVQMRRADGSIWPARCVAGEWVVDETRPRQPQQPASAPPPTAAGCGPQVIAGRRGLATAWWRYDGPRVEVGAVVEVRRLWADGADRATCTAARRLEVR